MTLVVARVAADDVAAHDAVLAIYRAAIEPAEQKPADGLRAQFADPRHELLAARDGAAVVGFALVFFPADAGFWLLEYMAVSGARRAQGIGHALMAACRAAAARRAGGLPGLFEVDAATGAAVQLARLRFYAREGCRRLMGLGYVLPLRHYGTPPPMILLVLGLDEDETVPAAAVRQWLSRLYRDVYGCDGDDPRIDAMLAGSGRTIELGPVV